MKKRNTAEIAYIRSAAVLAGLLILILAVCIISYSISSGDNAYLAWIAFGVFALFCVPLLVFTLVSYMHYRNVRLKYVQTVKLERATSIGGAKSRAFGFVIDVTVDGVPTTVTTRYDFQDHRSFLSGPYLYDYSGKYAEVGYDEEKKEWIVICGDRTEN